MKKIYSNLTPRARELMELLGNQEPPQGQAMQDMETILQVKLPKNGGEITAGELSFIACYVYSLGRINGIREERAKRKAKGQSKGGAEK